MSTIERIVPDEIDIGGAIGAETLRLHLERYRWAAEYVQPGDHALDMACGVGYGTRLLADAAGNDGAVTGVDVDEAAIAYAEEHYATASTSFRCADAFTFGIAGTYDVAVSLETIEHVGDPGRLVLHLATLVKPGGFVVASVPITPSVDINPHHRTDFTLARFRRLLMRAGLKERDILFQRQRFNPFRVLSKADSRLADSRSNLFSYYVKHPNKAVLRVYATIRFGFENRYAAICAQRPY
jgi:SAM-dependent methyltransferase